MRKCVKRHYIYLYVLGCILIWSFQGFTSIILDEEIGLINPLTFSKPTQNLHGIDCDQP